MKTDIVASPVLFLSRPETKHMQDRVIQGLHSVAPALESMGIRAAYEATGDRCGPVADSEIQVEWDEHPVGYVRVWHDGPNKGVLTLVEQMVQSWTREAATAIREEALLDELSSSWESLEALYEVSSSLRLSNSPEEILERLLTRAVTMGPELRAVLWVLDPDGSLSAGAVQNTSAIDRMAPCGPVAKCIRERRSFVVNDRAALLAIPGLPDHLALAEQVALAPILTSEGLKGALEVWRCVRGSEFNTLLLRLIEALAYQAGLVMDNDRLNRAFVDSARIRRDIEIGSSIQQTLLFGRAPVDLPGITVAATSRPSQTVDGDFYDFIRCRDSALDVLVGDVMGKGVSAALLGAAVKSSFFRAMALPSGKSGGVTAILRSVHDELTPELFRLESFVSLCYARFDLQTRRVDFVDCGHPRSIHYCRSRGAIEYLEGADLPVGVVAKASYEASSVSFAPGDLFLFYSDGISEARAPSGEFFGSDRLAQFLRLQAGRPAHEILAALEEEVFRFAGTDRLADDFTCVIVEIAQDAPLETVGSEWASSLSELGAVREWVLTHGRRHFPNLPDELDWWRIETAVAETFTNIVEHAYEGDPSRIVRVELRFDADLLELRFQHSGKEFDPTKVGPPAWDGSRDNGFGLFLVANTMDFVDYRRAAEGGFEVVMRKRLTTEQE